jgi:hypothetical protein
MNAAPEELRARGRMPDSRLEPMLRNFLQTSFVVSGHCGHAGDAPNARPLPRTTLLDLRDEFAVASPAGRGVVPEAVRFAIYADRNRVAPEIAVTVPLEHIWWLASSADTCCCPTAPRTTTRRLRGSTGRPTASTS